jgi:hypothetical protein
MKFGLFFTNANNEEDWMRESNRSISIWNSQKEADDWRKNHTVNPNKYEVKRVTPKIIAEDHKAFNDEPSRTN